MSRRSFTGRAASAGVALGTLHRPDRPPALPPPRKAAVRADPGGPHLFGPDAESGTVPAGAGAALVDDVVRDVEAAFDAVAEHLARLSASLRAGGRIEQADIMEVGGYLAQDPDLRAAATRRAARGASAAEAVQAAVEEYARAIGALPDPTLAERAADVRQVGRRALAWLGGAGLALPAGPLVLIAHEVGAADLLEPGAEVVAAASVTGGPNSHAAIVARSLGIPLLLGLDPAVLDLPDGAEAIVDGARAGLTVRPAPAERAGALAAMDQDRTRRAALAAERHLPCETRDRHSVILRANVATAADSEAALRAGADGVGLLRTELPFLEARRWPGEEQHAAALAPVLRELAGRPVTVRTLDFADDKVPPFLAGAGPDGRIGRGLPLMLARPDAFTAQFRALLTTGAGTDLRIMIPMVAAPEELLACRELLRAAAEALGVPVPPLGAMIELPEAVERADELAREAAFLSIGSNDLTGQILGLDRLDPAAGPAHTAHPEVLGAIGQVVEAAHRHRRQVSVCGDAAAHPLVMPLLIGLGCDVLSAAPAVLDEVRARVRRLDAEACAQAAREALAAEDVEEVWEIVERRCSPALP
ncbi:PEP-utilizing enzyme [Kitasatospora sp. NBC_00240]|uniref:putative PEP-binding protein n=1 Tax=Kitasatospora sp. NBC_00240 TaxID=2903567 RepID=UPI00225A0130|nr:putative PEP-binding protein [Kitasatospora sp. NBC_00240]MCX5214602.1 PEP-utilizing enzyme [Kitasatospora sp. NBC_00240]